ncbi:MAG: hypothetical protein H0U81_07100 [Pyrinomonadaceae bacterium]|nr:hypothetical protein [Pyrinomonadaceae bacterium]
METQNRDERLTARLLATQQVKVSWIYEDEEGFLYENVEESVVANLKAQSVKFKLQEKNDDDVPFEIIIKKFERHIFLRNGSSSDGAQKLSSQALCCVG